MRPTALVTRPKKIVAQGASLPAPVGGWDAISPLSNMPAQNAVVLVNYFPQPGYVEVRRGHVVHADTGTDAPVETVMGYQAAASFGDKLFAASAGKIIDVTGAGVGIPAVEGLLNNRWQHVNIATTGGNFLWACNGFDAPRYFDGTTWAAANITGVTASDMIQVALYRSRIWTVLKESTKAAYLPLDSIQGAATTFDVGGQFKRGGHLQAIGTWSTDTTDGPNELIAFISSFGEVAIYLIEDPSSPTGISYRGTAQVGSPIGRRCLTKAGADLVIISNDGVLPLSQAISYDRAALLGAALTKNIQPVVAEATRDLSDVFGWQVIAYPRGTMAILNVPRIENEDQEQFVMNTVTGAWARFIGQKANCWEIFDNRPFFGGNDGLVYEADRSGLDANGTLHADMKTAFNYYNVPGRQKRWTMIRPLINTDGRYRPGLTVNVDFRDDAVVNSVPDPNVGAQAFWDQFNWDQNYWPTEQTYEAYWVSVAGIGYCASIRMTIDVDIGAGALGLWDVGLWDSSLWDDLPHPESTFRVNGFDVLSETGDFI